MMINYSTLPLYLSTAIDNDIFIIMTTAENSKEYITEHYKQNIIFSVDNSVHNIYFMKLHNNSLIESQIQKLCKHSALNILFLLSDKNAKKIEEHLLEINEPFFYSEENIQLPFEPFFMKDFLPTCSEEQLDEIMGPIQTIIAPSQESIYRFTKYSKSQTVSVNDNDEF